MINADTLRALAMASSQLETPPTWAMFFGIVLDFDFWIDPEQGPGNSLVDKQLSLSEFVAEFRRYALAESERHAQVNRDRQAAESGAMKKAAEQYAADRLVKAH